MHELVSTSSVRARIHTCSWQTRGGFSKGCAWWIFQGISEWKIHHAGGFPSGKSTANPPRRWIFHGVSSEIHPGFAKSIDIFALVMTASAIAKGRPTCHFAAAGRATDGRDACGALCSRCGIVLTASGGSCAAAAGRLGASGHRFHLVGGVFSFF